METLTDPLQYALIQRALLELLLVGIACGVVGVFLILRGLAFLGEALGHCVVPGVVAGVLTRTPIEPWALIVAVLAVWGIGALARRERLGGEIAVAVIFTAAFAFGLLLISATRSYFGDLTGLLFGDVLGVTEADLLWSALAALLAVAGIFALYRLLVVATFDPAGARALGLPVGWVDAAFYGLVALAIVAALAAVGGLLVTALLIAPAATARRLTQRLPVMIALSAGLAALAGVVGLYLSYYLPVASGSAIVLTALAFFGLSLAASAGFRGRVESPVPAS